MATKNATKKVSETATATDTMAKTAAVSPAGETKSKRAPVRDIDKAKVLELSKTLYEIGGGTKTAVFRALFAEGYSIGEVFKACQAYLWPKLIRPHVQNEHARWVSDTKA